MTEMLEKIKQIGIIPVVVLDDAKDALPLGKALLEGGLPCAEVTFRTAAAKECIKILSEAYPDLLVGAGTVLTPAQVDDAIEAGAKFIVSPGTNPKTIQYCKEKGIEILPGTTNPSDIEQALENGVTTVKFFPAEAAGGLKMIKAMSAPYVDVTFMPTGGITADNVRDYLKFNKIIACGGSWMVPKNLVAEGKFDEITRLVKEASEIVKEVRG
ncbi:MAG: bifunctional 4-hydroxy-2-oxoglutarate aldolase/2-dehydro-3-deoxy-phosphogluconate aldolase [Ileibacterium sp.]|nr:bifunctional 4-hydroxy-2-oxoglutarate aldolase/2-dehydro-3-deoxy-phosphogluconate aldolase [Ileibacterium sp.]